MCIRKTSLSINCRNGRADPNSPPCSRPSPAFPTIFADANLVSACAVTSAASSHLDPLEQILESQHRLKIAPDPECSVKQCVGDRCFARNDALPEGDIGFDARLRPPVGRRADGAGSGFA